MCLLELAEELGLRPKRVAACYGGEYHSACPKCAEGKDRFVIWPRRTAHNCVGGYWCRRCGVGGDTIQFCRDFLGLSWKEAKSRAGYTDSLASSGQRHDGSLMRSPIAELACLPTSQWVKAATGFIQACMSNLYGSPIAEQALAQRGLETGTILRFGLGYNPTTLWLPRDQWGLAEELGANGRPKKQWLPQGLVIPCFSADGVVEKIKIRRNGWYKGDVLPKYVEVSGSTKRLSVFGVPEGRPVLLVEAELDAVLVQQEAGDVCACVALGGASKRPDAGLHSVLRQSPRLLYSLDWDESGMAAYSWWRQYYQRNLKGWPVPKGKSPEEAWRAGVNLREWIKGGLNR